MKNFNLKNSCQLARGKLGVCYAFSVLGALHLESSIGYILDGINSFSRAVIIIVTFSCVLYGFIGTYYFRKKIDLLLDNINN